MPGMADASNHAAIRWYEVVPGRQDAAVDS